MSYIQPRPWFATELSRAKEAFDSSPDRVTVVYFVSASGMACRLGKIGIDEVLDQIQQLCLQLIYERRGAIKISICADHGHNLVHSKNIADSLARTLRNAGFTPSEHLRRQGDVVINLDGLITYVGLYTHTPSAVADACLKRKEIELATYQQVDRVIVRTQTATSAISYRDGRFRYETIDGDALGYAPIIRTLRSQRKIDDDGFIADRDWFTVTVDSEFPDSPRRLWDAFHGGSVHPPDVMLTLHDGYCCGTPSLEYVITMASTHGGLNQINSATFLLTMTGRATHSLRSGEIIPTVEPGYVLPVRVPH